MQGMNTPEAEILIGRDTLTSEQANELRLKATGLRRKSDILFEICTANDVTIRDVLGKSNVAELSRVRRLIANEMFSQGYGISEIGRTLNRCHSAVSRMVGKRER